MTKNGKAAVLCVEIGRRTSIVREIDEPLAGGAVRVTVDFCHRHSAFFVRDARLILNRRKSHDPRRPSVARVCRIDSADKSAALHDETRNRTMDKARCQRMGRRVGREIPPGIYVVQKIADRGWFVMPVERHSEGAGA